MKDNSESFGASSLFFIFVLGILFGIAVSSIGVGYIARYEERQIWQNKLIELDMGEYIVNPKTGKTDFIIYSEEEENKND